MRRTNSSVNEDLPAPPVPVMPKTGTLWLCASLRTASTNLLKAGSVALPLDATCAFSNAVMSCANLRKEIEDGDQCERLDLIGAELKRMARLLLEDVTLRREHEVLVQIRFKGGATRELRLPLPKSGWARRKTKAEIIAEIDRLLEEHTEAQIAHCLNERGWCSSTGCQFNLRIVNQLRRAHKLKGRRQRLREQGWLTVRETAALLNCPWGNVNHWRKAGLLKATQFCNKNDRLYERPPQTVSAQIQSRRRCEPGKIANSPPPQSGVV